MASERLFSRNPNVMFGAYCVRGRRITVAFIRSRYRGGDSIRQIAKGYGIPESTVRSAINWRKGVKRGK